MAPDMKRQPLGEVLVEVGVITPEQYSNALKDAGGKEKDLGDALIRLGYATEAQIIKAIGFKSQIPYFDSLEGIVTPESARLIPEELSRKHQVVALFVQGDTLMLAMINPYDIYAIDDVANATRMKVEPVLSTRKTIFSTISKLYSQHDNVVDTEIRKAVSDVGDAKEDTSVFEIVDFSPLGDLEDSEIAKKAPIIKLVDHIIMEAITRKASDIHIEPKAEAMHVRYRLDGMLRDLMTIPRNIAAAITSRIKIMAKLDIAETRRPQDGRIQIKFQDKSIDLRVSVLPLITGEKTVIRILNRDTALLDLHKLGIPDGLLESYKKLIASPSGIMLVTGPTGSGKTTTLYSSLLLLTDKTKNITTLEDPVEYQIEGINQVQVNARIDLTFAGGLRSILRQDPDIILVGEIRDRETAAIAIQSALTGHMVFATLHTNDAPGAVARLEDMQVEPFLLATALNGILAQRLVRMLCKECREAYVPGKKIIADLKLDPSKEYTFYHPRGCERCFETGYIGRAGIYELLVMSRAIREAITEKKSQDDIYETARKEGFKTMFENALPLITGGHTSLEEVLRVTKAEEE